MKKPAKQKQYLLKTKGTLKRKRGSLTGVCAGLGEYFGINPTLVRLGFIVSSFFSGIGLLLYLALAFFLPMENTESSIGKKQRIASNDDDSAIFPDADLDTTLAVCWQCDTVSKPNSLYCHKCGAKL